MGVDALETVDRAGYPTLVLTDIQMPRIDGYELIAEIRGRGYRGPIAACSFLKFEDMKEEDKTKLKDGRAVYLDKSDTQNVVKVVGQLICEHGAVY